MLIEFSGIDGAGKTTFAEMTMRLFNTHGVPCYQRSLISTYKRIAADLSVRAGHKHWSELFSVDEIETAHAFEMVNLAHQHIAPLDLTAQVIVTDTYVLRWLATALLWQAGGAGRLRQVYDLLPAPDLTIDLRLSVETAQARIAARRKGDHILKIGPDSKLRAYAEAYEQARHQAPYPLTPVSAEGGLEETWDRVRAAIADHIRATGRHTELLDSGALTAGPVQAEGV
jgi:thymidylate kinase